MENLKRRRIDRLYKDLYFRKLLDERNASKGIEQSRGVRYSHILNFIMMRRNKTQNQFRFY